MLSSCNNRNNNNNNGLHPLQHHHQQSLPPEQQQQQQNINNFSSTYAEAQTYDGWPGMALKQIMGQIDLFNFQNPNYGVNPKWQLNKDFCINNSNSGYMPQCGERMPQPQQQQQPQHQQQQQQQQQQQFKANNYESGPQDNDNALAWLGPQLWNRRIGVDVSNDGSSIQSTDSDQSSSGYDAKVKTEISDGDSTTWFNNSSNSNSNNNSSNNSMDERMSETSSADFSEKDSFSKDEEDFSPADLALVTVTNIINFRSRP